MKKKFFSFFQSVFIFILVTLISCKVGPSQPKNGVESPFTIAGKLLADGADNTKAPDGTLMGNLRPIIDDARIYLGDSAVLPAEYLTVIIDSIALELSSRLFMVTDPVQIVASLRKTVFQEGGIRCDRGNNEVKNILPHMALRSRHGSALGISLLMLAIGQKMGLPLHGVIAQDHFFVRYDNGREKINIDPAQKGRRLADSWYKARFAVSDTSYFTLRNLEPVEVVAYVKYTIASIYRNHGLFAKAALYYESALREMPGFADVYNCLGLTYDTLGQVDKSLAYFLKAKTLRGAGKNLSAHIGKLFIKRNNFEQAVVEYRSSLRDAPNSPELLYGLGLAYYHLNDYENAYKQLVAAINATGSKPEASEASEAYQLLALVCEKTGENKKAAQYRALAVSRQ